MMSYFKSFRVLHFTVRSRMHFELILVKGVRSVSRFLVFCMQLSSCSRPFIKKTVLSLLNCLNAFEKDQLMYICMPILGLALLFIIANLSILLPILHCLSYCSSLERLEVGWCRFSNFDLLVQYCIGYSGSFALTYTFFFFKFLAALGLHCCAWASVVVLHGLCCFVQEASQTRD